MAISVEKLHPSIGAEVRGVDLSKAVDNDDVTAINEAFADNHVLLFRGQDITEEEHIAFGACFGPLERHIEGNIRHNQRPEIIRISNVDDDGKLMDTQDNGRRYLTKLTQMWHTDSSFRQNPSLGALLYAIEVPDAGSVPNHGAQTCYTNMFRAYETLPAAQKERLEGLTAVHSYEYSRSLVPDMPALSEAEKCEIPPVRHSIVRGHADGRKSIYISTTHIARIEGMSDEESRELVDELSDWATKPETVYQHEWQTGDLLMWDNRCTMHKVTPYDQTKFRRHMRRVTVAGEGAGG